MPRKSATTPAPAVPVTTATCLHERLLERSTANVTQPLTVGFDLVSGAVSVDYSNQVGIDEQLIINAWACDICGKVWRSATATLDAQATMWSKVVAEISKRRAAAAAKKK